MNATIAENEAIYDRLWMEVPLVPHQSWPIWSELQAELGRGERALELGGGTLPRVPVTWASWTQRVGMSYVRADHCRSAIRHSRSFVRLKCSSTLSMMNRQWPRLRGCCGLAEHSCSLFPSIRGCIQTSIRCVDTCGATMLKRCSSSLPAMGW